MPPSFNLIKNATNRKYLFQNVMYIINVIWWKPYIWISFIRIVFQNHSNVSNLYNIWRIWNDEKNDDNYENHMSELKQWKNILKPKKSLRCCCDFSGPQFQNVFSYSKISKRIKQILKTNYSFIVRTSTIDHQLII